VAFPTYTSNDALTIERVNHCDGVQSTYAFSVSVLATSAALETTGLLETAGSASLYTPVSQEEAWIFEELLLAVPQLVVA
jgi:hypothetical protein